MKKITISSFEGDDLYEFIEKVEKSFEIKFKDNELSNINTIDEFAEHIVRKLDLNDTGDCTKQQAFNKLREALAEIAGISKNAIAPSVPIEDLLPKNRRRKVIRSLENEIGLKLNLLEPKDWVTIPLIVVFVLGVIALFLNPWYGLSGIAFSSVGLKVAYTFGREFTVGTLGEVAENMAAMHYRQSRRNAGTINKKEVNTTLTQILMQVVGAENLAQLEKYARPA